MRNRSKVNKQRRCLAAKQLLRRLPVEADEFNARMCAEKRAKSFGSTVSIRISASLLPARSAARRHP